LARNYLEFVFELLALMPQTIEFYTLYLFGHEKLPVSGGDKTLGLVGETQFFMLEIHSQISTLL
jgi:hypothetical protein